jgi:hypothetical protein
MTGRATAQEYLTERRPARWLGNHTNAAFLRTPSASCLPRPLSDPKIPILAVSGTLPVTNLRVPRRAAGHEATRFSNYAGESFRPRIGQ